MLIITGIISFALSPILFVWYSFKAFVKYAYDESCKINSRNYKP